MHVLHVTVAFKAPRVPAWRSARVGASRLCNVKSQVAVTPHPRTSCGLKATCEVLQQATTRQFQTTSAQALSCIATMLLKHCGPGIMRPQQASATRRVPALSAARLTLGSTMRSIACRASSLEQVDELPKEKKLPRPIFAVDDSAEEEEAQVDADCSVYVDRDGNVLEVMCCDYGYKSGPERMYQMDGSIPDSGLKLAWKHFHEELMCIRRAFRLDEFAEVSAVNPPQGLFGKAVYGTGKLVVDAFAALDLGLESLKLLPPLQAPSPEKDAVDAQGQLRKSCRDLRVKLKQLKLSNAAVWEREHKREAAGGGIKTPWYVKGVYLSLCVMLDSLFNNRPLQRFWFLETVARMPYFSYISCLHLYESLGWWRAAAELRKIHFAEEWNELHHLQIMEALGGDRAWFDRFMGYHAAIVYYWILVLLFVVSPGLAYNFSELIEAHAVDTYGEFADANEELLKSLPPPLVAAQYYRGSDLYMFDEFQTSNEVRASPRTPATNNLYDVFINIRDDEGEHVKTMKACQDSTVVKELAARKETPRRL